MEAEFHTYLDYFLHTKSIIYVLIVVSLIGITLFWNFLAGKDEDNDGQDF